MPEGPSIVILKEAVAQFAGRKILEVSGNTKEPAERVHGKKVIRFESWGKHFLICLPKIYIRVHFMLFGSYRISEEKENSKPRLKLTFKNGFLSFYACSVKIYDGQVEDHYDWTTDIMSPVWNSRAAFKKLKAGPDRMVCDVLLDQEIFSGVGNIIKNEVLYRVRVHPETVTGKITDEKIRLLVRETRKYSKQFYKWKKEFTLKKHWKIYRKSFCPSCGTKITVRPTGLNPRRSFFCNRCQK